MKQIILIAIVLSSFGAVAQQKTDSLKFRADTVISPTTAADSATISRLRLSGTSGNFMINTLHLPQLYTVNWAKVKTFADLKLIMQNINIMVAENATNFKKIKKYLIKQK